jgi:hypothetical protein
MSIERDICLTVLLFVTFAAIGFIFHIYFGLENEEQYVNLKVITIGPALLSSKGARRFVARHNFPTVVAGWR